MIRYRYRMILLLFFWRNMIPAACTFLWASPLLSPFVSSPIFSFGGRSLNRWVVLWPGIRVLVTMLYFRVIRKDCFQIRIETILTFAVFVNDGFMFSCKIVYGVVFARPPLAHIRIFYLEPFDCILGSVYIVYFCLLPIAQIRD